VHLLWDYPNELPDNYELMFSVEDLEIDKAQATERFVLICCFAAV
jgi:hypothetical protein